MRRKQANLLTYVTAAILLVWLMGQLFLMSCHFGPQGGDWGHYIALARQCYDAGQWYPMAENIREDNYIFAPGLVNLLIAEARICHGIWVNKWLYLLMNIGVMAMTADMARRMFSAKVACRTLIISCLLYSNWFITLSANSELPFLFLCITGLWMVVFSENQGKCWHGGPRRWTIGTVYLVAGICMALANWIRPLGFIYVLAVILFAAITVKGEHSLRRIVSRGMVVIIGFGMMVAVIGETTRMRTGHFICQSTTGGFNLIMSANDLAFGGVDTQAWQDPSSTAYIQDIERYDCLQRDSIWRTRAVEWIGKHPVRYTALYLKKMPILFAEDSWTDQRVFPSDQFYYKWRHGEYTSKEVALKLLLKMSKSIPYYIMLVLAVWGMVESWRRHDRYGIWLMAVLVAVVMVTCLFPVQPRYHYPVLWILIVMASKGVEMLANISNNIRFVLHLVPHGFRHIQQNNIIFKKK